MNKHTHTHTHKYAQHTHTRARGEEAKKRKKLHKRCRRDVGNGEDLGGKRKKPRREMGISVAANPDNLENSKQARKHKVPRAYVRTVQVERVCLLCRVWS